MYKIGILGYFAQGKIDYGGQPVKTNNVYSGLLEKYGESEIKILDTGTLNNKILFLLRSVLIILHSKNLVIMPAHNGIIHFPKLYLTVKFLLKRRSKIHYVVIGGWLPKLLRQNAKLKRQLLKFDFIYVETNTMMKSLIKLGFHNVQVMRNVKKLDSNLETYTNNQEFIFCFYSRVIVEKGVEDAIEAIYEVNRNLDKKKCKLHIYGPISSDYELIIDKLIDNEIIQYKGILDTNYAPIYLSKYFMQIFPTKFYTEGVPGSIIDSFYSGLPVLASRWESVCDVIQEGYNGIIYNFNDKKDLIEKILWTIDNKDEINEMRSRCIESSEQYNPNKALKVLTNNFI